MVLSIEAKQIAPDRWEAYTDNGRERTGLDVIAWVKQGVALGAGEVLLTSVDREGTRKGFDIPLLQAVTEAVTVPVIASGGMGKPDDLVDAVRQGGGRRRRHGRHPALSPGHHGRYSPCGTGCRH